MSCQFRLNQTNNKHIASEAVEATCSRLAFWAMNVSSDGVGRLYGGRHGRVGACYADHKAEHQPFIPGSAFSGFANVFM